MNSRLVVGANGQLGRALRQLMPEADYLSRDGLDISNEYDVSRFDWTVYDTVINAAAFTQVDKAETPEGRRSAWLANVHGVTNLARAALVHGMTLVHISSDYVFDGREPVHDEDEPMSPLGVYGQTKAAGDAIISAIPRHFIIRTSWVIGQGHNFVRTMASLAAQGKAPAVVSDQIGRLSFADDIAAAISHLLDRRPTYGIYNVSNDGPVQSWVDIARAVFELTGHDAGMISPITTAEYAAGRATAPRPLNSVLDLGKIKASGYHPPSAERRLAAYLQDGAFHI